MAYDISLRLPAEWICEQDTYTDESGVEITHLEAQKEGSLLDIYVGEMPEGETAEDQALANYAETVGFYEDDPEDFNPIVKIEFNGKKAYGFSALCEDESPMRFIAQEVRKGVLAIIVFFAPDEDSVRDLQSLIEKGFRIKA